MTKKKTEKERIKELEERIKKLESEKQPQAQPGIGPRGVFGSVFENIGKLISMGGGEFSETKEIGVPKAGKHKKAMYGMSVRVGTIKKGERKEKERVISLEKPAKKELLFDVFYDKKGGMQVTCEVPGAKKKEDIKLQLKKDALVISSGKFKKEVDLKEAKKIVKQSFKNGILEIKLKS